VVEVLVKILIHHSMIMIWVGGEAKRPVLSFQKTKDHFMYAYVKEAKLLNSSDLSDICNK